MKRKETPSNCTRKMSAEEVAAIRLALKSEGIPIYPDRILAGPAEAATVTTRRIGRAPAPRR